LARDNDSIDDQLFLAKVALWANELPRTLRAFLEDFRTGDRSPACLITGIPVDDARIGPSPLVSNRHRTKRAEELALDLTIVLLSSCLGDIFGWRLQHDGSMIHDLAPRPEDEGTGLGTGSRLPINWHTEDAFHPCRADYVCLFCVRNPAAVATTVGFLDSSQLTAADRLLLSQPIFTFRPDPSYLVSDDAPVPGPTRGSVLFGDPADPYLRFDNDYIDVHEDAAGVDEAFDSLQRIVESNLIYLPLRPGDLLLLDNRRAVHGRAPFEAGYGGHDRWLKRTNVTRDIRLSRHLRRSAADRVILV
jgi:Fe(II)/alpha-ketoglutarate-dependent arginine beta-hydroxylase